MRAEFIREILGKFSSQACSINLSARLTIIFKKFWPDLQVSFRSILNRAVKELFLLHCARKLWDVPYFPEPVGSGIAFGGNYIQRWAVAITPPLLCVYEILVWFQSFIIS
jgi:hypothetical protein